MAEAEVVEVLSRTVFSIVFSGPGTVFSTVTVRARGAGGEAPSPRLLPIRPRRNPKSSPTTSTPSTSTTNLTSPAFLLLGLPLLPSNLLSLHSSCRRTHTCYSAPFRAPKQGAPLRVATPAHIVHAPLRFGPMDLVCESHNSPTRCIIG